MKGALEITSPGNSSLKWGNWVWKIGKNCLKTKQPLFLEAKPCEAPPDNWTVFPLPASLRHKEPYASSNFISHLTLQESEALRMHLPVPCHRLEHIKGRKSGRGMFVDPVPITLSLRLYIHKYGMDLSLIY